MEKRESIRTRMLDNAARLWGHGNLALDPDAFDPIVGLLFGACASEFDRVEHEIQDIQNRVFEQLVQLLLPGTVAGALPAHTILQARSVDSTATSSKKDQFLLRRPAGVGPKELYFSPLGPVPLFDAGVRFIAAGRNIWRYGDAANQALRDASQKELLAEALPDRALPGGNWWLGIEATNALDSPDGFRFCFDWRQDTRKNDYFRLLPLLQWWVDGVEWRALPGLEDTERSAAFDPEREFHPFRQIEEQVQRYYQHQFFRLKKPATAGLAGNPVPRAPYPEIFSGVFPPDVLQSFRDPLFWINVRLPQHFPLQAAETMFCGLNCFPVLNRRLHTATFNQIPRDLSLVPLASEDAFLATGQVLNAGNEEYHPAPFAGLHSGEAGTYTLRMGGVERFDQRSANEMLHYLRELLREEASAFTALDQDMLDTQLRDLHQRISVFEQRLGTAAANPAGTTPYLLLRLRQPGESLRVEWWSTTRDSANRIPAGTRLEPFGNNGFRRDTLLTVTATSGGRDKPGTAARRRLFKEAVLTRGRVVTAEDVRAVCYARAGDLIKTVQLQKGVMRSDDPRQGLIRTLDVTLVPLDEYSTGQEEWFEICRALQLELEQKSGGIHPFRVRPELGSKNPNR